MKKIKKYLKIIIILITISQISSCAEDIIDDTITNFPLESIGQAMFWTDTDLGVGSITVSCNGITKTFNSYYNSGAPSCGALGAANFNLNPGTYSYSANGGALTWNGSITVNSGGCSKMNLTVNGNGGNLSLNGKWQSSEGVTIIISGSSGVFNSFGTGNWKAAADKGFVKLGDLYLRNISNVNSTKWNAQTLWYFGTNGIVEGVKWGSDGTIIMSTNGSTFTLTGMLDGFSSSKVFNRVN